MTGDTEAKRAGTMMQTTGPSDDRAVLDAVEDELAWTPQTRDANIGVSAQSHTVTLTGEVPSIADRIAAEHAALRVEGVRAIVNDLVVRPASDTAVTEADVAREVDHALAWATNVPSAVKATIRDHTIVLSGEVRWNTQREAAQRAVQYLRGVRTVDNRITLSARPAAADAAERIQHALTRNALLDANRITVGVDGTTITLTGTVQSWAEKQQACAAAWSSPHATEVVDRLTVGPRQ